MANVKKCDIISTTVSDHSALFIEIALNHDERGRGFWKFNESLLEDKDFCKIIDDALQAVLLKNSHEKLDPLLSWEMIKNEIVGQSVRFSIIKSKNKHKDLKDCQNKIEALEEELDALTGTTDAAMEIHNKLVNAKHEYDIKLMDRVAKTINNTKSRWYNEGEASTKYFFQLQKQKYANQCMNRVYMDDGSVETEQKKILNEQKKFYEQVYQADSSVSFNIKNDDDSRRLNDFEKHALEEPLTQDELLYSVKTMAAGKTPGADGLTPALYVKFWNHLALPLLNAFRSAFRENKLHISARRGILNLIPKKGRDLLYVKNWRPITLLNTDYKILAKALANRIKQFLPKLISEDQTGFMKNRNISTNIRKIIDLDDYCQSNGIPALVLSVDFERCFDTIEISSIDKILNYFGVGENYRSWIRLLFKDMMVCTLNNGYTSDYFSPTRGLFQGNPIASYLYLLTGQVLHDQITKNKNIRGIQLGETEIKAIQFADDLNMPLQFEQATLDAALDELTKFQKQVGLKINLSKSCLYKIGTTRDVNNTLDNHGIPWSHDSVRVLGIDVTDSNKIEQINIDPLLLKMQGVANTWKARDLGLVGKVLIINTLFMSLLVYRISVLPTLGKTYLDKVRKIWSDFLWDDKKPKIAWNILTAPKQNGGLGLSDLSKRDASLKVQWVKTYTIDPVVRFLADSILGNKLGSVLWQCNFNAKDVTQIVKHPGFWNDVVKSWASFNFHSPFGVDDILDQVIWFNSHIKVQGKLLFNIRMFRAGIIKIQDLIYQGNVFLSAFQFQQRFPGINIMEYFAVIQAIPLEWKQWLAVNRVSRHCVVPKYVLLEQHNSIVSLAYKSFHTNVYLADAKRDKWCVILNISIWPNEFLKLVGRIWMITNYGKLRSFQYRLFMHAIITNVHLKIWKIIDNDFCTFCKSERESILHLLCDCPCVKHLWKTIENWCNRIEPYSCTFSKETIIFNSISNNPKSVVNTIVLIAKYYIYKSRCFNNKPNVIALREEILWHHKMELLGARVKHKVGVCEEKWLNALTILKY